MGRFFPIAVGAALTAGCLTVLAGAQGRAQGLMPYPMEQCRALADALARDVPLPKPFAADKEWFRDGDLGLKGWQCRISADGPASKKKEAKAPPGLAEIADSVARVLKARGFKDDALLKRYEREEDAFRAFALRKDRATCRVNLERERDAAASGVAPPNPAAKAAGWRLTVDCFLG